MQNNIYIVYSSVDEDPSDKRGWLSNFHNFLQLLLRKLSGVRIELELVEERSLDFDALYHFSTILVPVVTPGLLRSAHFNEEIKKFHEKAINKETNNISWNSRVFKVLKEPPQEHYLLDFLSKSTGYNFFHIDHHSDRLVPYDQFTGSLAEKTFWMRLYDLAYDLLKMIRAIESAEDELNNIHQEINQIGVFLALTGNDLTAERDVIKRELMRSGYRVYPEVAFPADAEACIKAIRRDLGKSCLAIHLIGADPGKLDWTDTSLIDFQNRQSIDYNQELKLKAGDESNFHRIMWFGRAESLLGVKQRLYVENLKKDPDALANSDVLEGGLEEVKAIILDRLAQILKPDQHVPARSGRKVVYVICDRQEHDKCNIIEEFLKHNGFEVLVSAFEGSPEKVRLQHDENLRRCDATLIYYGNSNQEWMKSKIRDLMKALALGREKPISPQAILIENEQQLDDAFGLDKQSLVIHQSGGFSPEVLQPFLSKLMEHG